MLMLRTPRKRVYHLATLIRSDGKVSAMCFKRPHPIDMRPTSRVAWTLVRGLVTCRKCRAALAAAA